MTRPLYFIDWPLSVVADTALLPINIPRYYLSDDEARKSCGQYGDPNNKHPWIKDKKKINYLLGAYITCQVFNITVCLYSPY